MTSLPLLVDGSALLTDTSDGAITAFGIMCLLTGYIPHALNPVTSVLRVAALPHASAKKFPNVSFVMPLLG
jgi:hypothetical protein